ncbi:MAG: hypothetical protein GY866_17680 [Proteobacteria bacterium]|nr:hypothetical protein [Pseudomonadota bacterium]
MRRRSKSPGHRDCFQATTVNTAVRHLDQMLAFAAQAGSREHFKELLDESLNRLKDTRDSDMIKALLASTVAVFREHADLAEIREILKLLAARMKEFLFDKEVRNAFLDILNQLKSMGE